MTTATLKLYDYPLSGNCFKVRQMVAWLGVAYQTVPVDFFPGREHKSAAFLANVNPLGQLPVIDDDGFVLRDAQAILVYLASRYDPQGRWYPPTRSCAARSPSGSPPPTRSPAPPRPRGCTTRWATTTSTSMPAARARAPCSASSTTTSPNAPPKACAGSHRRPIRPLPISPVFPTWRSRAKAASRSTSFRRCETGSGISATCRGSSACRVSSLQALPENPLHHRFRDRTS